MTNAEYLQIQHQLGLLGELSKGLDLETFRARIRQTESVGPVLDPTLYRAATGRMMAIDGLAAAFQQVQRAARKLEEVVRETGGGGG